MRPVLLIALLFVSTAAFTQSNISGTINTYHKIIEVLPANACVRVDNSSGLAGNDFVVIVQMKGAVVSTTNSSAFGSVTNLQNAGNYEIGVICAIRGDSVFLVHQLLNQYTVADKVQLVKIPQYVSATVTDTLKAAPWDSASGKGGVLAFFVSNDLVLNAPVSATGTGFRGGAYMLSSGSCSNFGAPGGYAYNPSITSPQNGAYKGESATSLDLSLSGGKGAAANGGGGGNNHNNGGGGGSNISAGGGGGGNSSATGCSVSNPGIGGYALNSNSGTKFFLGGGGGAGHVNSGNTTTGGGNGGGIIILHANNLISNGYKILANGAEGGNALGDGASGGGSGGTVLMDVNNYLDAVNVEARGGNGGTEDDDNLSQRCYGEGGGGGGGVIYFKTVLPTGNINVAGGAKGLRINSLNCATLVTGVNGTAGLTVPNYSFRQSATLSGFCGAILDVENLWFHVSPAGNEVNMEWQVNNVHDLALFIPERSKRGGNWNELAVIVRANNRQYYQYTDKNLAPDVYHYRLKYIEKDGRKKYSTIKTVRINGQRLKLYPNPATDYLSIHFQFKKGTKLKAYNSLGEAVIEKTLLKEETVAKLDVSHLANGIYYLVIDSQRVSFVIK